MVVARGRRIVHDDFHAAVWRVIGSLSFFAIIMPDVVRILFVELQQSSLNVSER